MVGWGGHNRATELSAPSSFVGWCQWAAKGMFLKSLHRKQREFWGPMDLEVMDETMSV